MRAAQRYASAFAGSLFKQITELGSSAVTR
jgi:hypothetical protein